MFKARVVVLHCSLYDLNVMTNKFQIVDNLNLTRLESSQHGCISIFSIFRTVGFMVSKNNQYCFQIHISTRVVQNVILGIYQIQIKRLST